MIRLSNEYFFAQNISMEDALKQVRAGGVLLYVRSLQWIGNWT
jgi:hypothetical protein